MAVTDFSFQNWRVDCETKLPDLALKMASDYNNECPLYFVTRGDDVLGIATYADLNRKTCYLYTYTLTLALEHWIKLSIMKLKPPLKSGNSNRDWVRILSSRARRERRTLPLRDKIKNRVEELMYLARTEKASILTFCYFEELLRIVKEDEDFHSVFSKIRGPTYSNANEFRLRVAHPTKLLVPNKSTENELRQLAQFWKDTRQFLVEEKIRNEKNRDLTG